MIPSQKTGSQEKLVQDWNQAWPTGTPVQVRRDNGEILQTRTRSQAWVLGEHTAVVQVEGIAGCYALDRVRPEPEARP